MFIYCRSGPQPSGGLLFRASLTELQLFGWPTYLCRKPQCLGLKGKDLVRMAPNSGDCLSASIQSFTAESLGPLTAGLGADGERQWFCLRC